MPRILGTAAFVLTIAASAIPASLEAAPDEVLFLGNSFTIGGTANVPTIFDRLAIAGGKEDPTTVMRAVGGKDYQFHETDATSRAQIAARQWTHVVMQNYSTEPTHIGSVSDHHTYGNLLYDRILANNPATKVVLFETWSRAAAHPLISGTSTATTFASTVEMQSELRTNYADLAASLNAAHPANPPVTIAPVGDAWENAGGMLAEEDPFFTDLHGPDNYHGNDNGYFLAAAVIYAKIYQSDPAGLHLHSSVASLNLNLTEDPAYLERIAWETVTGNGGIRFVSHPQSVTVAENQTATFTAAVTGAVPYDVQWYRDGEIIPGATSLTLTVPGVTAAMDGDVFTVKVTNATSAPWSDPATLRVTVDEAPPVPSEPVLVNARTVKVPFNEALATGPAGVPGNFTVVYHGRVIGIQSAVVSPDGRSVALTLAEPITGGFAVGVSGAIGDLAGNHPAVGGVSVSKAPVSSSLRRVLIDFGSDDQTTDPADDPAFTWNNVTSVVGTSDTGRIDSLTGDDGLPTGARLEMIRRFGGTNANGTQGVSRFPVSATRDTLYGNTEVFSGRANIFPAFRLAGLNPAATYGLTFYASRTGTSDNRTTLYTVTGAGVSTARLNAANNVDVVTTLDGLSPTATGELTIELSPAPENNNANHFTYLGALVVSGGATESPRLYPPVLVHGQVIVDWTGAGQLESTPDFASPWVPVSPAPAPPVALPQMDARHFYRLGSGNPPP